MKSYESLFGELQRIKLPNADALIVEEHGTSIIHSCNNFFEFIARNYTEEERRVIEQKLILGIKNRNVGQFTKAVRRLEERKLQDEQDSQDVLQEGNVSGLEDLGDLSDLTGGGDGGEKDE